MKHLLSTPGIDVNIKDKVSCPMNINSCMMHLKVRKRTSSSRVGPVKGAYSVDQGGGRGGGGGGVELLNGFIQHVPIKI